MLNIWEKESAATNDMFWVSVSLYLLDWSSVVSLINGHVSLESHLTLRTYNESKDETGRF